jgi:hypothetical protein
MAAPPTPVQRPRAGKQPVSRRPYATPWRIKAAPDAGRVAAGEGAVKACIRPETT